MSADALDLKNPHCAARARRLGTHTHTPDPIPAGVAPSGLASHWTKNKITLNWWGSACATSYNIQRATTSGGPCTVIGTSGETDTFFTDANVANSGVYFYVVSAEATVTPSVFNGWLAAHFAPAQSAHPLISGADADANGDGLKNLLACAFHANPWTTLALPTASQQGGYLTLTFTRRKAPTDVTYTVEVSSDLTTWESAETETSITSLDATTEQVSIRDEVPMSVQSKHFIRLRVVK